MTGDLEALRVGIRSLTVFRGISADPLLTALADFLDSGDDPAEQVDKYCAFAHTLYESGSDSLTAYVRELVRCCETPVSELLGVEKKVPPEMMKSAENELKLLSRIAVLTPDDLQKNIGFKIDLPGWETEKADLLGDYSEQMKNISKRGYGIYAKYKAFRLVGKSVMPIEYPDPVRLSELIGYRLEKEQIILNTRALITGKPAANILLTGDAGTGKSSTVKAVVNELWEEGLRILELKKEQLHDLPEVLSELNRNPLKFIIFIDDLSFTSNDDNFSALKAILEGTVSARARNVVIYATSNRRHLIKESFSDRDGDDIHRNDTMQETVSLSERFGLHITFSRPDKATYLDIVEHLCKEAGVRFDPTDAERFALTRASRSARAARQYVDSLVAGEE